MDATVNAWLMEVKKKKKVGVYGILAHVKGIPGGPNRLVALQFLYVIVQVASLRENPQNSLT